MSICMLKICVACTVMNKTVLAYGNKNINRYEIKTETRKETKQSQGDGM